MACDWVCCGVLSYGSFAGEQTSESTAIGLAFCGVEICVSCLEMITFENLLSMLQTFRTRGEHYGTEYVYTGVSFFKYYWFGPEGPALILPNPTS